MTPIDDLNVGDVIAVVCRKSMPDDEEGFTGQPLRILAISLPFIACTDEEMCCSIDLRAWGVQRMTPEYYMAVRAFKQAREDCRDCQDEEKPEEWDDLCKRCGDRLVQRVILKPEGSEWHYYCRQCEFDGGPVEAAK